MSIRSLPLGPAVGIGLFLTMVSFGIGAAVGSRLMPAIKIVEVPVEVVRTVQSSGVTLNEQQKQDLAEMTKLRLAAARPDMAMMERAVMSSGAGVKVLVMMSDELNLVVSRESLKEAACAGLRSCGVHVLPDEYPSSDFNTTVMVVLDTMVQGSTGIYVGSLQMNINQSVIVFSGTEWRKSNLCMHSTAQTISYGRQNLPKLPSLVEKMADEVAAVIKKANEESRTRQLGR